MRFFLAILVGLLAIVGFVFAILAVLEEKLNYPVTDHYDRKKFYNQDVSILPKNIAEVLKWKTTSRANHSWPNEVIGKKDEPPSKVDKYNIRISSVGHATFLLQLENCNILTDPVWSQRASPISWIGPKRVTQPGIDFDKLPKIDIVLVSHNHYDHLDTHTIKKLWTHSQPIFIVPLANQRLIKKILPNAVVHDLDWYEDKQIGSLKIYAIPSQHWSSRSIVDVNKNLWAGFIVESEGQQICFIGDSGYNQKMFRQIGNRFQNIIFAIVPIGSYEPRWFMKPVHMNPQEALLAFQDMRAKFFIPSHFAVFKLSDEGYYTQLEDYRQAISDSGVKLESIITLMPGEYVCKKFKT
jgi:L-ascorbate metabolism protein UlaG (beta-lactamase superfamily)